jgi:hypothetical protein
MLKQQDVITGEHSTLVRDAVSVESIHNKEVPTPGNLKAMEIQTWPYQSHRETLSN